MKTQFLVIDYSFTYYSDILISPLPAKRSGKFVQIIRDTEQKEYFVMSPKELSVFHANIVERFCVLNEIDGRYNSKRDFFHIADLDWTVYGGGMFAIDDAARVIKLHGYSTAYGNFNADRLKDKLQASGQLQGYQIIIDG
jgi:hypothetical protein